MLITRECDYAVRIVRALAGGEQLCVNQICEKEDLTPAFVYKILKKLEKKEIVKSFRGSNGGYALKKSLGELTLLDVYLAVEPDFYMIECMNPDKACVHNQSDSSCKVHRELHRIQKQLAKELSVHSIKEIMERDEGGKREQEDRKTRSYNSHRLQVRSGILFKTIFKEEKIKWLER